jgi:hypothetical protein
VVVCPPAQRLAGTFASGAKQSIRDALITPMPPPLTCSLGGRPHHLARRGVERDQARIL